jgi:hypothetical protein
MNSFQTISLAIGLTLAGTAIAHAGPQGMIRAKVVICATRGGIEAVHPGLNVSQLQSLGCSNVDSDLRVDILPPSGPCDSNLFVAATLPDKVIRYWVRRDDLEEHGLFSQGEAVDCK